MRRFAIIMAVIIALGVAAYVWVDTQWFGGWGTPGYVEDARTEILATPLFNDPPPTWTKRHTRASTGLGGEREHIAVSWAAPGTIPEAVKALHDRHAAGYIVRRGNDPRNRRLVLEVWTRRGSELSVLVSYNTTVTPNQIGVEANVDVPRELLKDPRNR